MIEIDTSNNRDVYINKEKVCSLNSQNFEEIFSIITKQIIHEKAKEITNETLKKLGSQTK